MTDPRFSDPRFSEPRFSEPQPSPFVAPSNPGFAPPPASPASGGPSGSWPAAGAVPFTPYRRPASGTAVAALVLSILGAVIGLAIGWGFPLSIVGLVLAVRSRREPGASRSLSTWSVVLAIVSGLASVGWLAYSLVYLLA